MDHISSYYKAAYKYNAKNNILWTEIGRYLHKYIAVTDKVLDLGAGYCYFINNLECDDKTAVDISPKLKEFAQSSVKTFIMPYDLLDSYFQSEFDIVFASNFFEHLTQEECRSCLKKVWGILKPDGRLLIIQPNFRYCYKDYFDDYTHKTVFDHKSICQLLIDVEFEPIIVKPKFMPYTSRGKSLFINKYFVRFYLYSPIKLFPGQMLIVAKKAKER